MNTKDEEKDYKELYIKAMLHIANLEIAQGRQLARLNFYQEEIKILEFKIKELNIKLNMEGI